MTRKSFSKIEPAAVGADVVIHFDDLEVAELAVGEDDPAEAGDVLAAGDRTLRAP
jgi:hypothetical protein